VSRMGRNSDDPGARDAMTPGATAPARERKRLRSFGLTVGIAFGALAVLLVWKHRPLWPFCAGLGALLGLAGLMAPHWLRPIERVWMRIALALGWVMTRVILGIVFALIFAPAGLALRVLGKDPLELRFDKRRPSYWHPRADEDRSPARMERMF
jgi:hypothetical protein